MERSNNVEAWKSEKRAVELTNAQWNSLSMYLLLTAQYRHNECESWAAMAKEVRPDGEPKFEHAASNHAYWVKMDATIDAIRREIDG